MKGMKKWLTLSLATAMCLSVVPAPQYAREVKAAEVVVATEGTYGTYGEQLTDDQKAIYRVLQEKYLGADGLSNGVTENLEYTLETPLEYTALEEMQADMSSRVIQDVQYAFFAFEYDYPQLFWMDNVKVTYGYSYSTAGNWYCVKSVTVTPSGNVSVTADSIAAYNASVKAKANEIVAGLSENATEYEYHKAIHDWVCKTASYNYTAAANSNAYPEAYTSEPVFTGDGMVVCEGYGESYKILCDQISRTTDVDLNSILVTGVGVSSSGQPENHLWNLVQLSDGEWYGVDATWDDQVTKEGQEDLRHEYFLCGQNSVCFNGMTFGEDHLADPKIVEGITFQYPTAAEYGYNGYFAEGLTWSFKNGELSIGGAGELPSELLADRVPWRDYKDQITSVKIESGITYIPEGFLKGYDTIETLTIPFIGSHVDSANTEDAVLGHIFGRANAGTVQYYVKADDGRMAGFYYQIPETLREVHVTNETSLPFGAFSGCANLTEIYLNAGITKVESCAFYECSGLKEVYFEGNAPTIVSDAFRECGSLNAYIPAGNTTWTDAVKQNYYASAITWLEKVIVTVDEIVVAQPAAGGVPTTLPGKDGSYTVATTWTTLDGTSVAGTFADRTAYKMTATFTAADGCWFSADTKPTQLKVQLPSGDTAIVKLGNDKAAVSADEKTITVTNTFFSTQNFRGGSLRKTLSDGTEYENAKKTGIRFGYHLYQMEGYTLTDWNWSWGTNVNNLKTKVQGVNCVVSKKVENAWNSNLVILNVPVDNYKTVIYTNMVMTYTNDSTGEEVVIDTGIVTRTVYDVANDAVNNPVKPGDKEYGQKILSAYENNGWTGYY